MKKLLIFLAVLTWTSLTLNAQQGEIIYIDFEPDSLVELKQYDLYPESKMMIDFDYDGHPDIRITSYVYSAGGWFDMICYEPEWELHEFRPCDTLTPMNEPEHYWSTRIAWMWDYCNGIDTISDKFAVRHKVGDAYYYGWFRVYITRCPPSPYPWVALDKMAYCTDPNYPLVWGQTEIPPQPAIIYTDYDPDSCITDQYTRLWVDFDDDGNGDICLKMDYTSTGYWPEIISSDDWEITWLDDDDTDTIPNIDHWGHSYLWLDDEDQSRFAARKQIETDKYVFAWFEAYNYVTFNPFVCHVCFDKYAFCTIPNYPLEWGQTTISQSVEEETVENLISVYPNPANTVLVVETQCFASQPTTTEYHIINMMGQTILSGSIIAETQQINIECLPAGLYFISVGNMTQKFVVK